MNSKKKPTIEPVVVEKSEMVFVTSVHIPTLTFFAQLCKNTVEELNQMDEDVNTYCTKMAPTLKPTKKIRCGDYVCAKYRNGLYYRSLVLDRNKDSPFFWLQMIDYGNFQPTEEAEILVINPDELLAFKRQPFGITCSLQGTSGVSREAAAKALNCLYNNYLLINVLGQQTPLQYVIDIPKVCYNMPFWDKFDPNTAQLLRRQQGGTGALRQGQDYGAFFEEESLDESP